MIRRHPALQLDSRIASTLSKPFPFKDSRTLFTHLLAKIARNSFHIRGLRTLVNLRRVSTRHLHLSPVLAAVRITPLESVFTQRSCVTPLESAFTIYNGGGVPCVSQATFFRHAAKAGEACFPL